MASTQLGFEWVFFIVVTFVLQIKEKVSGGSFFQEVSKTC